MDDINNSGLTPGFIFVIIPSKRDSTEVTDHRDGAAMYFIDDAPSHTGQAKWSAIELLVEVTPDSIEDDPFDEIELNYESSERVLPFSPAPRPVVTLNRYPIGSNDKATASTTLAQAQSDVSPTTQIQAPESKKAVAFEHDPANAHPITMIIQNLMAAVHAGYVLLATPIPEHGDFVNRYLQPRAVVEVPVNEAIVQEPDKEIAEEPHAALDFLMNVIRIPVEWKSGPPVRDAPIKLPAQDRLKYSAS
ncbi:hypothetical protein C8Q74DRAFT_1449312 [Fomes fomentarius]|nr:hypothetical protein C8Q74DRAFT_1449312 [Fomes fomentarius]